MFQIIPVSNDSNFFCEKSLYEHILRTHIFQHILKAEVEPKKVVTLTASLNQWSVKCWMTCLIEKQSQIASHSESSHLWKESYTLELSLTPLRKPRKLRNHPSKLLLYWTLVIWKNTPYYRETWISDLLKWSIIFYSRANKLNDIGLYYFEVLLFPRLIKDLQ